MKQEIYTSELFTLYLQEYYGPKADKLGYPRNFTIYDTDDAKSVVKTVVNELNLDDKHYKPNTVYNRISAAKNALITAAEYMNDYGISTGRYAGKQAHDWPDI